ncbi:MAG: hypothetical protein MPJ24_07985 [Pirellulaceae bacterium]|nr:hypothetical protein [Pirellulaceae bacterium]
MKKNNKRSLRYKVGIFVLVAFSCSCFAGAASNEGNKAFIPSLERELHAQRKPIIPQERHIWAKFPEKSWIKIETVREEFDREGNPFSKSTTLEHLTLQKVTRKGYQLESVNTHHINGKRLPSPPTLREVPFLGMNGSKVELVDASVMVEVNGYDHPCEKYSIVSSNQEREVKYTVYVPHNSDLPQVIRSSEETRKKSEGKASVSTTEVEAITLEIPGKVKTELKNVSYLRLVKVDENGQYTIRLETYCSDIPGGIVSSSSNIYSKDGQLKARIYSELKDYEIHWPEGDESGTGHFKRLGEKKKVRIRRRGRRIREGEEQSDAKNRASMTLINAII